MAVVPAEQLVGQQRVKHDAETPHVRLRGPRVAHGRHLGRRVTFGASEAIGDRRAVERLVPETGVAKVAQLDARLGARTLDEHVLELNVAMQHTRTVQVAQRRNQLRADAGGRALRECTVAHQQLLQVTAGDQAYDERDGGFALVDAKQLGHRRVRAAAE
eukprot:scaffold76008_cov36-Phaeocystis_antarctica.AAC.1